MTTGSPVVDAIGKMQISGNIIPQSWYKSIRRETGKPYLTAIVILADLVYWYRPMEIRDEETGNVKELRRKFRADKLQRSYQQLSDMFGISKKEATSAIVHLEKLGVLTREFRSISVNGVTANNVLFIELIPDKLQAITYPENAEDSTQEETPLPQKSDRSTENNREVYAQSGGTNTETSTETFSKSIKKERKKSSYDDILSKVANDELRELYYEFIKMRQLIKKPMTDLALNKLIQRVGDLEPIDEERQKQMLENAIMKNWLTVYPIKDDFQSSNRQTIKRPAFQTKQEKAREEWDAFIDGMSSMRTEGE